jgi:PAS domain S-box-containing protein
MKKMLTATKSNTAHLNQPERKVDEDFDGIVALASQICKTPVAIITFTGTNSIYIKARKSAAYSKVAAEMALISDFINNENISVVHDVLEDERFDNLFETGTPDFRFFATIPIKVENHQIVGQLILMDFEPRTLTEQQISSVKILAKQAGSIQKLKFAAQNVDKKPANEADAEFENVIFQKAFDAVIVLNDKGLIEHWNPKAEVIFKWKKEEIIGKSFNETIISSQFREILSNQVKTFEETGVETWANNTLEITAIRKDLRKIDIELGISATTIKGRLCYILFISDNTKQKLVISKMDKQKEFYENTLNKIPTDIAVFDPDHKYLFVNPGAIQNPTLRKFIVGKDDFEYANFRKRDKRVAEQRREKFLEVVTSNKEIRWEDSLKDPNGNTITHLRRLFPVHDEDGKLTMVIGFGIDITERKLLEEKQTILVRQLSAQNTQLVDFCNIVSHNLRAPLANMSMLVNFINEAKTDQEQNELIAMLNPVIDNLHRTFNELVESIQIKQDIEIQSENIVLQDCLKRTIEGLELKIKECSATIETDFEAAPVIRFPSKYMLSIFHNLITNALKYHDPSRELSVKLRTQRINDTILFSVQDNGLGLDVAKHKDSIFKIGKVFHRHPNAKGFGLFMTKTQVEACGGKIWVESVPGEGSTFFISFVNQG